MKKKQTGENLHYGFYFFRTTMVKNLLKIFAEHNYNVVEIDDNNLTLNKYRDAEVWEKKVSRFKPNINIVVGRKGGMAMEFMLLFNGTSLRISEHYPNDEKKEVLNSVKAYIDDRKSSILTFYNKRGPKFFITLLAVLLTLSILSIVALFADNQGLSLFLWIWGAIATAIFVFASFVSVKNRVVQSDRDKNLLKYDDYKFKAVHALVTLLVSSITFAIGLLVSK
jgi:hypothetical protein